MASLGNPKTWGPYLNSKDCSQGFCSLYCPQWCYIIYPPPPPFEFPDESSSPSFSPLVIAVIGILASAFLLVSYYIIITKYCNNRNSSTPQNQDSDEELDHNHNRSVHEPWHVVNHGLDEALIKSIKVYRYKKGNGLMGVTDCSVCLSEFQEDENIRLLPTCSHAFHIPCIDTWLKSHSNCPLCRSFIFPSNPSPPKLPPPPVIEMPPRNETLPETQPANEENERGVNLMEEEITSGRSLAPKPGQLRALSDLGNVQGRDATIEIRDEGYIQSITRSVSMDHSYQLQTHLSVADMLHINQDELDARAEGCSAEVGPSKQTRAETSKSRYKRRVMHCVISPIAMKRSFSSGRFSLPRHARGQHGIVPV